MMKNNLKQNKKRAFKVTVEMPLHCTVAEMKDYIEYAVAFTKDRYHPNNPLFDLDSNKVKVEMLTVIKGG